MGLAQQREASVFFTEALTSTTTPDPEAFLAKARQYQGVLCGGSELSTVAEPIAVALFNAAVTTHHGQLRWLLQLCSRVLQKVTESPNEAVDPAVPAVVHLTELLLRQVLRLAKGNSVVLVGILELGGHAEGETEDREGATASPPSHPAAPLGGEVWSDDAAALLCKAAFTLLIHVTPTAATVLLHLEVLRLLLTLTSSALHHGTEFHEETMDLFTELMMSSPQLPSLMEALLKIFVGWGKADWRLQPPVLYHEGCQPSLRNFFQVFGTGGTSSAAKKQHVPYVLDVETTAPSASASVAPPPPANASGSGNASGGGGGSVPKDPVSVLVGSCSCWEQLGRHAAALLCVLVVHQKGGGRNPALEYTISIQDSSPVSFVQLLSAIRWTITRCPEVSILLYVLLHDHHEFLHTVLSQDAALLVSTMQQLLELTYKTCKDTSRPAPNVQPGTSSINSDGSLAVATSGPPTEDVLQTAVLGGLVYQLRTFSYPFINFMSSTLLLLTSQDCVVNRLLCNTPCLPGHLLERHDANAPVGALAIVVLALGITKGFNERNEALIAVFAPCLVNMAPFVHDIDPYSAQRVAGLLALVLKKLHRAGALLQMAAAAGEDGAAEGGLKRSPSSSRLSVAATAEEAQALEEISAMYQRQLRTVVEGVEALLRGPNRRNEHLIYELLYARGKIIDEVDAAVATKSPFAAATKQLLVNLVEMIKNCEADIASSDAAQSPQEIIAILRRGQRQSASGVEGGEAAEASAGGSTGVNAATANSSPSLTNNETEMRAVGGGAGTAAGAAAGVTTVNAGLPRSPGPAGNVPDGASMDLVYSYEESPHSYDFFGPFVWSILLSASRAPGAALWCHRSSELALFPH